MNDYYQWVEDGQLVEARYATPGFGVHAKGYVYGYADRPTVLIVQPDGREITWLAGLCAPVDGGSTQERTTALSLRANSGAAAASTNHLEQDVAYWRGRAEAAEKRLKEAANFFPDDPPEPPVGTRYLRDGEPAWERRVDGWHCSRTGCRNCPTDWNEAWEFGIHDDGLERRLP